MIVSRAPFRLTLGGGGTDLPSFYSQHGGMVFAMGIDKYMYVAVNPPVIDRKIRVKYTKSEIVEHPDELQHELAREALKRHAILSRMEVTSMADLPAGSGLGSSSAYLVGLLSALRTYRSDICGRQELAEEACEIELDILDKPIGKQDQYMAAFGGLTNLDIDPSGAVQVRSAKVHPASLPDFIANLHIYFTGVRRSAPEILQDQDRAMRSPSDPNFEVVQSSLQSIKEIGYSILTAFEEQNYDRVGELMDEHWKHKRAMSSKISLPGIDSLYSELKTRFGVLGGKVSGAGGGGFFVVYAPSRHRELNGFMEDAGLQRMHYGIEFEGTKIISNSSTPSMGFMDHGAVGAD